MDNLTKIVRTEIDRQYKSVRQFAFAVDIPLSTINSALHSGIGGSSFDTVVKICKALGIQPCVCIKDTLENYEKSVRLGCRMFTSNDPETAARLLRELGVRDI